MLLCNFASSLTRYWTSTYKDRLKKLLLLLELLPEAYWKEISTRKVVFNFFLFMMSMLGLGIMILVRIYIFINACFISLLIDFTVNHTPNTIVSFTFYNPVNINDLKTIIKLKKSKKTTVSYTNRHTPMLLLRQ